MPVSSPSSPPVIPPMSPPFSCANTFTNPAGIIPAIKTNARTDVITIEWIFDSMSVLVKNNI